MSNIIIINNYEIDFEIKDSQVFITSLDIAKVFQKRHTDILRNINKLPKDNFTKRNFGLVDYKDVKGQNRPSYNVTRDGFCILAMALTGLKAYQWKIAFIEAFNRIEFSLREKLLQTLPNKLEYIQNLNAKIMTLQEEKFNLKDEIIDLQRVFINSLTPKPRLKALKTIQSYSYINKYEKEEIISLHKQGKNEYEISDSLNKSPKSIKKIIDEEIYKV